MSSSDDLHITIGQFALITRLSKKALRLYDRRGILVPARDPVNNYRYYGTDQIDVGLKIKMLAWMGFGLAEIETILDRLPPAPDPDGQFASSADRDYLENLFKKRLAETQVQIQELKKVEEVLLGQTAIDVLYMKDTPPTLKEVPAFRVISKRERGPVGPTTGQLIGELMAQIYRPENQRGQVTVSGPPMTFYHDFDPELAPEKHEIDLNDLDIEIAFPVTGKVTVDDDFEVKNIPDARVVSVVHTGPYDEVSGAYRKVFQHVEQEHLAITGVCREIYLNNPQEVPPEELLTEVQLPVA